MTGKTDLAVEGVNVIDENDLFEEGTRPYRVFLKTEGYSGTCILRPTELEWNSVINYSALRRAKTAIPVYIP